MTPLYDVIDVRVQPDYKLAVVFEDGLKGTVDLSRRLHGTLFGSLRDEVLFAKAYLDLGTVVWPGGADLAPDVMYDEIRRSGSWVVGVPSSRTSELT